MTCWDSCGYTWREVGGSTSCTRNINDGTVVNVSWNSSGGFDGFGGYEYLAVLFAKMKMLDDAMRGFIEIEEED